MTVYVDQPDKPFGRMMMCHMIADSSEELLCMVDAIGVQRKWIQKQGTEWEHFDICKSKRQDAISYGAIELGNLDLGRKINERRKPSSPQEGNHAYQRERISPD